MLRPTPPIRPFRKPRAGRGKPVVPPVPPPVDTLYVVAVTTHPTVPDYTRWVFSLPVNDPSLPPSGFFIESTFADWVERESDTVLVFSTSLLVTPGLPWSNAFYAAGLVGPDGEPLLAGEGVVVGS